MACKEGRDKKFDHLLHKGDYHHNIKFLKVGGGLSSMEKTNIGSCGNYLRLFALRVLFSFYNKI